MSSLVRLAKKAIHSLLRSKKPMIEDISIRVSGPICKCKTKDISWGFNMVGSPDKHYMFLTCNLCGSSLRTSFKHLSAGFTFVKPYPEETPKKNGKLLELLLPPKT